jgi:4-diphosphocytidyl-2-C-methyl-D-erythritol kinase
MIFFAPAKINLGLQVLDRRSDGFHNIQTIMHLTGLCDILEIKKSDKKKSGLEFTQSGIELEPGSPHHLCVSAWEVFQKEIRLPPLAMHLHKQIPVGAGLGGGSSDATSALLGINRILGNPVQRDTLHRMATSLGSDCPFFLHHSPMLAEGKGERLTPVNIELSGMKLVLFHTGIHISTAEAYAGIHPSPGRMDLHELPRYPVQMWKEILINDFEVPVFNLYPELGSLKRSIYTAGATYASLSGSGAAIYGIFDREPDLPRDLQPMVLWKGPL